MAVSLPGAEELLLAREQELSDLRVDAAGLDVADQRLYFGVIRLEISKALNVVHSQQNSIARHLLMTIGYPFATERTTEQFNDKTEATSLISGDASQR